MMEDDVVFPALLYPHPRNEVAIDIEELKNDQELLEMSGMGYFVRDPSVDWNLNSPVHIWLKPILKRLDARLRVAMGQPVLNRDERRGGEFRVPDYNAYIESLEDSMWRAVAFEPYSIDVRVVPYSHYHEGRKAQRELKVNRTGFLVYALCAYEYAYEFWDVSVGDMPPMREYAPDLYDDATFGAWLGLLPQPVELIVKDRYASLRWGPGEPRVCQSQKMGRYLLEQKDRFVETKGLCPKHARALAYVLAWEKMAANEPADRYRSEILRIWAELD